MKTVRKTRSGNVVDSRQSYDNDNLETRDRSSQTEFPQDFQHQAVLGQYLETKLGQDFNELGSDRENPHFPSSEIVIVEYEQEEII